MRPRRDWRKCSPKSPPTSLRSPGHRTPRPSPQSTPRTASAQPTAPAHLAPGPQRRDRQRLAPSTHSSRAGQPPETTLIILLGAARTAGPAGGDCALNGGYLRGHTKSRVTLRDKCAAGSCSTPPTATSSAARETRRSSRRTPRTLHRSAPAARLEPVDGIRHVADVPDDLSWSGHIPHRGR